MCSNRHAPADIEKHAMPSPLTQLGCERLKQQLAAIKIDGQPVPFAHPEKAPQKVLGVLVTPTLNWKPQIDTLLEEAKRRAGKIVESDATPRQKLTWIQTCLKPYLTYSFPLTYLAKQDIYRLDAVLAQAAKRALRLPLATPTGLVLQQQRLFGAGIESLLIDYAQLGTAHLTRALNDTGKLGTITKHLMQLQHEHLGLHHTWQMGKNANHYRIMKQLELASEAGLRIRPIVRQDSSPSTGNDNIFSRMDLPRPPHLNFTSLVNNLHADPWMLGEKKPIPAAVYHCLAELGINNLQALVCKNRRSQVTLIDTAELRRRYGPRAQVRHMKALNKLTVLANQGTAGCTTSLAMIGSAPIASNLRTVHASLLEAEFTKHRRLMPESLEGDWSPKSRTDGTQLIQAAFSRVLQSPMHPDSSVDQPMDIVILPKARRSRKRKPDPAYARRHAIDTTLPSSPQPQQKAKRGKDRKLKALKDVTMAVTVGQTGKPLVEWLQGSCPAQINCSPPIAGTQIPEVDEAAVRASFDEWRKGNRPRIRSQAGNRIRGIFIKHIQSGLPESQRRDLQHPKKIRQPGASHADLERLYGEQNHMWRVLAKCKRSGQVHYQVMWQPTFMLMCHVDEYRKIQYAPESMERVTQFGPQVAKWLKLVSLKASWEPRESVIDHSHLEMDMLAIEAGELEKAARRPWPRGSDPNFPNLERQSFFHPEECQTDDLLATEPHLGRYISINTGQTVNPDLDIYPTGLFTIAPVRVSSDAETGQPTQFAIHDPEGQALSTITEGRLRLLFARFNAHQEAQGRVPGSLDFPEALAKLMYRYKEGCTSEKYIVRMRNYWTTPDSLMRSIAAGLSATQERFACPLNFSPSFKKYYSPFPEDCIFGASTNAYSCKWTGSSQAHPEYSSKEMQKAVRWAIGSSLQTSRPSLTTFLLPFDDRLGSAYQQWLGHPAVYQIARIPKAAIRLQTPNAWQTGTLFDRHPRHDLLLFAVGNAQGINSFINSSVLEQSLDQFMAEARVTFEYNIPSLGREQAASTLPFYAPRGCTNDLPDTSEEPGREGSMTVPSHFLALKPLRWRADQIIYTDGSVRDTGEPEYYRSGTGVYRPPSEIGPCVQM